MVKLCEKFKFIAFLLPREKRLLSPKIVLILLIFGSVNLLFSKQLHIAYTGNLNCNLEACDCGGNVQGGMVRLAQAIDSLKHRHPDLILLDSGDFFNSYTLPRADSLMWEFMLMLKFDAITPGDQEYVEGIEFLNSFQGKNKLPLISANIFEKNDQLPAFEPFRIIHRDGLRIGITGITLPESFSFISEPALLVKPWQDWVQKALEQMNHSTDLNILLLHGGYREGIKIAGIFPEFQIIIAGHTQEQAYWEKKNQVVVQSGVDGEILGLLEIEIAGGTTCFRNQFLPVGAGYGENLKFKQKVDGYYQSLKNGK